MAVLRDALLVGGATFLVGSVLKEISIKQDGEPVGWWPYVGTFIAGSLGFYLLAATNVVKVKNAESFSAEDEICAYCEEEIEGNATLTQEGTTYHHYCADKLISMAHQGYDGLQEEDIAYWGAETFSAEVSTQLEPCINCGEISRSKTLNDHDLCVDCEWKNYGRCRDCGDIQKMMAYTNYRLCESCMDARGAESFSAGDWREKAHASVIKRLNSNKDLFSIKVMKRWGDGTTTVLFADIPTIVSLVADEWGDITKVSDKELAHKIHEEIDYQPQHLSWGVVGEESDFQDDRAWDLAEPEWAEDERNRANAESFEMEGMLGNWEGKLDDEPVYCPNCKWDGLESDLVQRGGRYSRWICPDCMRKDWEYKTFENVMNSAESFAADEGCQDCKESFRMPLFDILGNVAILESQWMGDANNEDTYFFTLKDCVVGSQGENWLKKATPKLQSIMKDYNLQGTLELGNGHHIWIIPFERNAESFSAEGKRGNHLERGYAYVAGSGDYRFNVLGTTGKARHQYRFETLDEITIPCENCGHRTKLERVLPYQDQWDFPSLDCTFCDVPATHVDKKGIHPRCDFHYQQQFGAEHNQTSCKGEPYEHSTSHDDWEKVKHLKNLHDWTGGPHWEDEDTFTEDFYYCGNCGQYYSPETGIVSDEEYQDLIHGAAWWAESNSPEPSDGYYNCDKCGELEEDDFARICSKCGMWVCPDCSSGGGPDKDFTCGESWREGEDGDTCSNCRPPIMSHKDYMKKMGKRGLSAESGPTDDELETWSERQDDGSMLVTIDEDGDSHTELTYKDGDLTDLKRFMAEVFEADRKARRRTTLTWARGMEPGFIGEDDFFKQPRPYEVYNYYGSNYKNSNAYHISGLPAGYHIHLWKPRYRRNQWRVFMKSPHTNSWKQDWASSKKYLMKDVLEWYNDAIASPEEVELTPIQQLMVGQGMITGEIQIDRIHIPAAIQKKKDKITGEVVSKTIIGEKVQYYYAGDGHEPTLFAVYDGALDFPTYNVPTALRNFCRGLIYLDTEKSGNLRSVNRYNKNRKQWVSSHPSWFQNMCKEGITNIYFDRDTFGNYRINGHRFLRFYNGKSLPIQYLKNMGEDIRKTMFQVNLPTTNADGETSWKWTTPRPTTQKKMYKNEVWLFPHETEVGIFNKCVAKYQPQKWEKINKSMKSDPLLQNAEGFNLHGSEPAGHIMCRRFKKKI